MIYENINYLLKLQNRRVSELEKHLGVAPGYFSRAVKHGWIDFPLSKAKKTAEFFGISIDELADDGLYRKLRIEELRKEIEQKTKEITELERTSV